MRSMREMCGVAGVPIPRFRVRPSIQSAAVAGSLARNDPRNRGALAKRHVCMHLHFPKPQSQIPHIQLHHPTHRQQLHISISMAATLSSSVRSALGGRRAFPQLSSLRLISLGAKVPGGVKVKEVRQCGVVKEYGWVAIVARLSNESNVLSPNAHSASTGGGRRRQRGQQRGALQGQEDRAGTYCRPVQPIHPGPVSSVSLQT